MSQKQQLIEEYEAARQTLLDSLDGLNDDDYLQAGAVGVWSLKDLLAHITAWESELVTALVHVENNKGGMPHIVQIEDIDQWNEEQYHISARRPLDIIRQDFAGIKKHVIEAIQALDDKTLFTHGKLSWMEGEALAYLVYENAIWHEEEHAADVRHWREEVREEEE